jgi:Tol biopolymer transport system component
MFRRTTILGAFCVLLVLIAGTAIAKKPPKPPPPDPDPVDSGVIYYETGGELYAMDPDGSNQTSVSTDVFGAPSRHLHACPTHSQDERFFLAVQPVGTDTYPNQVARHELFAVCEQGAAFRLTDAPLLEPDHTVPAQEGDQPLSWHPRPQWFDGDTQVSYTAMQWDDPTTPGTYEVVEWGFYTIAIDPENLDDHTATEPAHIDVTVVRKNPDHWSGGRVNVTCSWSPDGTAFVYKKEANTGGFWRADYDAANDAWDTEQIMTAGGAAKWSPVASRILFKGSGGFVSMDPYDDTDQVSISVDEPRRSYGLTISGPTWSPNGTHFVYTMVWYPTKKVTLYPRSDIFRDKADGGGDQTNLTDNTDYVRLAGWVADS